MMPNITLNELNRDELSVFIPSIAYLCVMVVVGFVGNAFVVIVYGFKIKKHSTYRHFILVLAAYDLTACCIGMPGLMVEMSLMYLFNSSVGCKVLRYGYHTIAAGTSMTHAIVGIDRYRRICRSTDTQITVHGARSVSYVNLVIALVVAMPAVLMYDSSEVDTGVPNISGHRCIISPQYRNSHFPIMYSFLLMLIIVTIACSMIVLYTLIGRKMMKRLEFLKTIERSNTSRSAVSETGPHHLQLNVSSLKAHHPFSNRVAPWQAAETDVSEREVSLHTIMHDNDSLTNVGASMTNTTQRTKSARLLRTRNRELASRKMTITTFGITVAFIGSFMPMQILEVVNHLNSDIAKNMTYTEQVFYRMGFLTYTIDNVANPIIYLFLDADFRHGCKEFIRSIRCK